VAKHSRLYSNQLIREAKQTDFGKDHNFNTIKSYTDFVKTSPIEITGRSKTLR
jgi:hypothetical protein